MRWLTVREAIAIHRETLRLTGDVARVRDIGLLESALQRPVHAMHYGETSFARLAALLMHGIVRNHPFVDGNKRGAFVCTAVFCEINGYELSADEAEVVAMLNDVAASKVGLDGLSLWIEDATRKQTL